MAQDGVRVRANAGSGSFRRAATVADHLAEAEAQVAALKSQVDEDGGAAARRSRAARARTASERLERLRQAQTELAKIQAANAQRGATPKNRRQAKSPEQLRVSTTDPQARRMKMGDGGFRPAYNVQFAATTTGGVVVGVSVTNAGSDAAELEPMLKQLQSRYRTQPREVLVDGGFATHDLIGRLDAQGIATYMPQKHKTHPDKPCRRQTPRCPGVAPHDSAGSARKSISSGPPPRNGSTRWLATGDYSSRPSRDATAPHNIHPPPPHPIHPRQPKETETPTTSPHRQCPKAARDQSRTGKPRFFVPLTSCAALYDAGGRSRRSRKPNVAKNFFVVAYKTWSTKRGHLGPQSGPCRPSMRVRSASPAMHAAHGLPGSAHA